MSIFVAPQSTIALCKVPLEDNYKNQIQFPTRTAQINYFNRSAVKKHEIGENTYIRENGSIVVYLPKEQIQTCNYLFYTNNGFGFNGGNDAKTYYCFITKMEYLNENSTRVYFKTDCYQTWLFQINYNRSFIEREHVNNDAVGANTVPENLETGEYVEVNTIADNQLRELVYLMQVSRKIAGDGESLSDSEIMTVIGDISQAGKYYWFDNNSTGRNEMLQVIKAYTAEGRYDDIVNIYLIPKIAISGWITPGVHTFSGSDSYAEHTLSADRVTKINKTYTPRNKKVLTYPYNFMVLSNNNGNEEVLRYEDFTAEDIKFNVRILAGVGGQTKCIPQNYKGVTYNLEYAVIGGKYPVCSWSGDAYINWLTQNSINIAGVEVSQDDLAVTGGVIGTLSGIAMSGIGAYTGSPTLLAAGISSAGSSLVSIGSSVAQGNKHELMSPNVRGSTNGGDLSTIEGSNTFYIRQKTIKTEYARIIDGFFDMFGYKVNILDVPHITGRRNWNYVKTISCNFDGDIPNEDLSVIRQAFDSGITLWHNPDTIYDYSQPNDIIV